MARANGMRSTMFRRALKAVSKSIHQAREILARHGCNKAAAAAAAIRAPGSKSSRALAVIVAMIAAFAVALSPASATNTTTYSYDALGRLVSVGRCASVANTSASSSYTYDDADNRTHLAVNAGSGGTVLGLSPTSLPDGTVGTAYNQTISASGGTSPYTYSETGTLPTGLTMSSAGVLSGTPTSAATYSFAVTATDSSGNTGGCAYSVLVVGSTSLTVSPTTLPNGTTGTAYSQTITASGGTGGYSYAVTSGTLPTGLTLNSSSGVLRDANDRFNLQLHHPGD